VGVCWKVTACRLFELS